MALLKHPIHGEVLFDTGYSHRFRSATNAFPYRFYRWITPVTVDIIQAAENKLQANGINYTELKYVILSHFHADHMGALKDFNKATFLCTQQGYDSISTKTGFDALKKAFLPDLLPHDFAERASFIENFPTIQLSDEWQPFTHGKDLFGDGSMIAIDLPGHSAGQIGIIFQNERSEYYFLIF